MAGVRLVTSTPALRGEYLKVQAMTQYSLAEAIAIRLGPKPAASMFPRILAASVTAALHAAMDHRLHSEPPVPLAPLVRQALGQLADGMHQVLPPPRSPDSG